MRAVSALSVVLLSSCITNNTIVSPAEDPAAADSGELASPAAGDAHGSVGVRPEDRADAGAQKEPEHVPQPASIPLVTDPPLGSPVAVRGQLSVKGTQLLDRSGQPCQLRGISTAPLDTPGAAYALNEDGLRWLRDRWKVQLVRAAMPFDGPTGELLAPEAIEQNKTKLEVIIRLAAKLGIYVVVDLHSRHASEHMDEAKAIFAYISEKYGQLANVIYEPFNEPLKVSWSTVLKPYHQKIVKTIRDNGAAGVVVLGTPNWSQSVDEAALDQLAEPNVMYALHFNTCEHDSWLRDKADAAWARKLPMFVTAWSATYADDGHDDKTVCSDVAGSWKNQGTGVSQPRSMTGDDWHAWMDTAGLSWAAWRYDACDDAACLLRPGAPETGDTADEWLQGQGSYVRSKLLQK